ncbi:MAG: glycosyltransferase, partial [Armatimonadetes bacterium]|nr:glycosyltransferase [Armatimonadota bacterium]
VVDDASADDLAAALAPFRGRIAFFRHERNMGLSATRNTGVRHATGEILAFLDADDWWPEGFLQDVVPQVARGSAVCYDNYIVAESELGRAEIGTEGRQTLLATWRSTGPRRLCRENMDLIISIPSLFKILVHRGDFALASGYHEGLRDAEDFHFCMKLLAHDIGLTIDLEHRGFYLVRSTSLLRSIERSAQRQLEALAAWRRMFEEMPRTLPLPEKTRRECRRLSRYYQGRYADALFRHHWHTRHFREMTRAPFLRTALPAIPAVLGVKGRGLVRRLGSRRAARLRA